MAKARVPLNVRPEDRDLIRDLARERGTTMMAVVDEMFRIYRTYLANQLRTDMLDKNYIRRDDLDAQARNIVQSMFQPVDADYFLELCDLQYRIPAHFLLAGILKIAREQGQWTAFIIDPAWQSGEVWQREVECRYCKKVFCPKRMGQVYCSNECAAKDAQAAVQKGVANG